MSLLDPRPGPHLPPPVPWPALQELLRSEYRPVASWSSRTSRLSRLRPVSGGPEDVVVKVCPKWSARDARTSVEAARLFAPLGDGSARVLRILAWSDDPAALVSELVPGEELSAVLRRVTVASAAEAVPWLDAVGRLLGRLHGVAAPPGTPSHGGGPGRRVLSGGDFACYNFRLDASGALVYLEPPSSFRAVVPYRDLAWFLASAEPRLPSRSGVRRLLRQAFLGGYRAESKHFWRATDDLHLLVHRWRRRRAAARRQRATESRSGVAGTPAPTRPGVESPPR